MKKQRELGRGLDTLLSPVTHRPGSPALTVSADFEAFEMNVSTLRPGRFQPRQSVSEESLAELAASIREQGVLQPLVVRPLKEPGARAYSETHEIVAGERRWRAAQLAGLAQVPVVVRELDDQSALAVALIENLQREDLNPMEQANSLLRLAGEFNLTHQQVADAVGRSRSSVTNLLRLLDLHSDVKELLAAGRIDMGHARAMLPLDADQQVRTARKTQRNGLSVRQVENEVRVLLKARAAGDVPASPAIDLQTRWLQQQMAKELGQKVSLRGTNDGNYRLGIEFADLRQLEATLDGIRNLVVQVNAAAGPRVRDTSSG
ncbi:MAG: ParB/RepB/Spo0J family partition protein [Woeseiaceae bacterium]|nr:ParB/RepB/Spo0J family partition protein [Woeseiaceae bacterium]